MAVNKVIYNNETLIDLTTDTVTADKLLKGYTAHNKKGEKITGTHEETLPTGTKTITANGTYDVTDYATAKVNVPVPNGYVKPSGTKYITTTDSVDVTSYANAQISSSTLIAENIKKGVNILGTTGTYEGTGGGGSSGGTRLKTLLDATKKAEYLFSEFKGESIDGLIEYNDTEKVTNFNDMFFACNNLKSIIKLNTNSAMFINGMFCHCHEVETIDLSYYYSNIGERVFAFCWSLKTLVLRSFGDRFSIESNAFNESYHMLGIANEEYNPEGLQDGYVYVPRNMKETLQSATNWVVLKFRALEDYTVDGTTTGDLDWEKINSPTQEEQSSFTVTISPNFSFLPGVPNHCFYSLDAGTTWNDFYNLTSKLGPGETALITNVTQIMFKTTMQYPIRCTELGLILNEPPFESSNYKLSRAITVTIGK